MRTLIVARHAEAGSNVDTRTSGRPPGEGLTPAGRRQAALLGEALAGRGVELAAATAFARTRETAGLALPGTPLLVVPELDEIGFGRFEGGPLDAYRAWAWSAGPDEPCPGGGESRAAAAARFATGLELLLARAEDVILLVAHALPLRYLLDAADGLVPSAKVAPLGHAVPSTLRAEAVARAAATLAAWSRHPRFRTPPDGG